MRQEVGPVRKDVDDEPCIAYRDDIEKPSARRGFNVERKNSFVIGPESELSCGAKHSFGNRAADFPLLDLQTTWKHRADRCERIQGSFDDVRRAAYDVMKSTRARIDLRHPQVVRIGMATCLDDLADDDSRQVTAQNLQLLHRCAPGSQQVAQLGRREIEVDEIPQPLVRSVHPATCSRNRMSESYSRRMSGSRYRSIAMRAGPIPNAQPVYFSASTPQAVSTLGWTMPEPRISIHPVFLQPGHPLP